MPLRSYQHPVYMVLVGPKWCWPSRSGPLAGVCSLRCGPGVGWAIDPLDFVVRTVSPYVIIAWEDPGGKSAGLLLRGKLL